MAKKPVAQFLIETREHDGQLTTFLVAPDGEAKAFATVIDKIAEFPGLCQRYQVLMAELASEVMNTILPDDLEAGKPIPLHTQN